MPRRLVVRRALYPYPIKARQGHLHVHRLYHAVPLLEPQALCGLTPRKGWDTQTMPDTATRKTVTCPKCRKWLPKETKT